MFWGGADGGEWGDGGTRAVFFWDPRHNEFGWPLGGIELPLAGRPPGEARVSTGRASRTVPRGEDTRDPGDGARDHGQSAFAKREAAVCGKSISMARKKKSWALTEFHTVKRIDNSRIVRHVEPMKMRRLYRTVALSSVIAAFFMLYIYQHFRCIDLSFQLEDVKGRQAEPVSLNSSLKLEIAGLRNPMRIYVLPRPHLGLPYPLPPHSPDTNPPDPPSQPRLRYPPA